MNEENLKYGNMGKETEKFPVNYIGKLYDGAYGIIFETLANRKIFPKEGLTKLCDGKDNRIFETLSGKEIISKDKSKEGGSKQNE